MENKRTNAKNTPWEIIFLSLLSRQDMYGSQMYKEIKTLSDGKLSVTTGAMYLILYKMSDNNYVEYYEKTSGRRRVMVYYRITDAGREKLKALIKKFREQVGAVEKLLSICEAAPRK
ncbi:MAG: PadR family transcriptional regulator [Butyrivibrio sp.]|nr:PadR family transcriptional regulator [Butyrivibrio sp.]